MTATTDTDSIEQCGAKENGDLIGDYHYCYLNAGHAGDHCCSCTHKWAAKIGATEPQEMVECPACQGHSTWCEKCMGKGLVPVAPVPEESLTPAQQDAVDVIAEIEEYDRTHPNELSRGPVPEEAARPLSGEPLPPDFEEWWAGYMGGRSINPFPDPAQLWNAKQAAWSAWHQMESLSRAQADRIIELENTDAQKQIRGLLEDAQHWKERAFAAESKLCDQLSAKEQ